MTKKKNSVALFEVIQKKRRGEETTGVPKWMAGQPGPAVEPSPPEPRVRTAPMPAPVVGPEPILAIVGERLRLSLDTVSCAVAAGGVVVLLAVAFALGFWAGGSGSGEGAKPGGTLRDRTQFGRHVIAGRTTKPSGAASKPAGAAARRASGKWYLVIQGLMGTSQGDLEEAARIVAFCSAKGQPATVARYTSPRSGKQMYIAWSLTPQDSATGEQARKQALAVEAIGKEYFAQHKTYDFRQRKKGGKFDPWFEVQR